MKLQLVPARQGVLWRAPQLRRVPAPADGFAGLLAAFVLRRSSQRALAAVHRAGAQARAAAARLASVSCWQAKRRGRGGVPTADAPSWRCRCARARHAPCSLLVELGARSHAAATWVSAVAPAASVRRRRARRADGCSRLHGRAEPARTTVACAARGPAPRRCDGRRCCSFGLTFGAARRCRSGTRRRLVHWGSQRAAQVAALEHAWRAGATAGAFIVG